jgi:hypothetical protein
MHHDPTEINNAARAGVVKITNPHTEDQPGASVPGHGNRRVHPARRRET